MLSSLPFPGIRLLLLRLSTEIGLPWLQLSTDCLLSPTPPPSTETDRGTERETETKTDRQTDRQADRQAGRQAGRQTDRQTDVDKERPRETETKTETKTKIETNTDRQIKSERYCYCCVLKRPKHVKVFGLESPWHPNGTMAPSPWPPESCLVGHFCGENKVMGNSNLNSKTLILKDSSVRSIWTYLTASPLYTTNTNKHDNTTNK